MGLSAQKRSVLVALYRTLNKQQRSDQHKQIGKDRFEKRAPMNNPLHIILLGIAWLSFGLAIIGIFVPVLPTTPLLLLAGFLFGKYSPKAHARLTSSKAYRAYVVPFKEAGGMPIKDKVRMLVVSYAVLGVSAFLVRKIIVWVILGLVALFLLYLVLIRIPTVDAPQVIAARAKDTEQA